MGLRLNFSEPFTGEMLSTLIQRVVPLNFTAAGELPAFLGTLDLKKYMGFPATLSSHSLAALYRDLPDFTSDWRPIAICLYFGLVITIGFIFRSNCSDEASKEYQSHDPLTPLDSGYSNDSDAQFAEELQVEEVLFASVLSAETSRAAPSSSSIIQKTSCLFSTSPRKISCAICFENKKEHEMFTNQPCSHSFCLNCTSRHIAAKIQENIKTIKCPEFGCNSALDYTSCREVIPKDIIVKWDECLCKSMFPESQIVYCPFRDCSAMLVKDQGEVIRSIRCPACRRHICALCRVPWHSEFTCDEFGKMSEKKKGKEDLMLKELAKKKMWKQCPRCKYYVEKMEGCVHITCRCKYEFCYRCGSKWDGTHGSCNR